MPHVNLDGRFQYRERLTLCLAAKFIRHMFRSGFGYLFPAYPARTHSVGDVREKSRFRSGANAVTSGNPRTAVGPFSSAFFTSS
ncbi:hypothetical protein P3T26_001594 [Streptomyces sp. MAA16]|nr:hypothetical protein [Streptomyces sp. MAA16]